MGTLYLVGTPIGNLEDISLRALRVLRSVPCVAAEDTRVSRQLFRHYDIETPLVSYHKFNEAAQIKPLLQRLSRGDLALVSDAGMPGINDPGYLLVREALAAGHRVIGIPGPTAPILALAISGLPTDRFLYLGFLPRKSNERQRVLNSVLNEPGTLIFLVTPHRLRSVLVDMMTVFGQERQLALMRELTKMHEEAWRGSIAEAIAHFQEAPRGEMVLLIEGNRAPEERWSEKKVRQAMSDLIAAGVASGKAAQLLSRWSHWPHRQLYEFSIEQRKINHTKGD